MATIDPKKIAAEKAVEYVENGMILGLGTGSTTYWAIQRIGQRIKEGLKIRAVASSEKSAELARKIGISLTSFSEIDFINLTIDGADEVDKNRNLIKGGGGALLREKIIASNSERLIIVVDESKMVKDLGKFPLPVEVVQFASSLTLKKISGLGCEPILRMKDGREFITDNGNYIVDCNFRSIIDPAALNLELHQMPGVVETGLFVGMSPTIIVGHANGEVKQLQETY
jgi:ribose 5-phosphate isomerase A